MQRWVVAVLLVLASVFCGLLHLVGLNADDPDQQRRALGIARMATGLLVVWVWVGGALMYRFRDAIRARVLAIPLNWRVKFILFCVALACLEEAVTVSMTNLAPLFGSRIGEAYITASANWLDVILFHSVVVFVPYFIVLAWLLGRWNFGPFAVFLAFGAVGTVAEAIFSGNPALIASYPIWAFVYGLMVWLPVHCLPGDRGARPVGLTGHVVLPFAIFGLAMPMILPIVYVIGVVLGHPAIDFAVPAP